MLIKYIKMLIKYINLGNIIETIKGFSSITLNL